MIANSTVLCVTAVALLMTSRFFYLSLYIFIYQPFIKFYLDRRTSVNVLQTKHCLRPYIYIYIYMKDGRLVVLLTCDIPIHKRASRRCVYL
jgi:hypothetical protein